MSECSFFNVPFARTFAIVVITLLTTVAMYSGDTKPPITDPFLSETAHKLKPRVVTSPSFDEETSQENKLLASIRGRNRTGKDRHPFWNDALFEPELIRSEKKESDFLHSLHSDKNLYDRFVGALRPIYPFHTEMLQNVFSRDALPSVTSSCGDSAPTASVVAAMERRIQSCVRRGFWDNVNGSQLRPVSGLRRPSRRALPRTSPYATASSLLDCRPCMDEVQHNVVAGSIRGFNVRRGLTLQLTQSGRSVTSVHTPRAFNCLIFNWDDVIFGRDGYQSIVYNQTRFEFFLRPRDRATRVDDVPHEVFVVEKNISRSERRKLFGRPRKKHQIGRSGFGSTSLQALLYSNQHNVTGAGGIAVDSDNVISLSAEDGRTHDENTETVVKPNNRKEGSHPSNKKNEDQFDQKRVQLWFIVMKRSSLKSGARTADKETTKWRLTTFITVEGETDTGDYQQNALRRSFATIYNAPVYVLRYPTSNLTSPYRFHERCPRKFWPHMPCATQIAPHGKRDLDLFPKYTFQNFKKQSVALQKNEAVLSDNKVRIAVGLAGLLRAASHPRTIAKLKSNVLNFHKTAHVYISTWNVIGDVHKGQFTTRDFIVAPNTIILRVMRRLLGSRLIWLKEHDYKDAHRRKNKLFTSPIAFHFHISHCVHAVRTFARKLRARLTEADAAASPHYYDVVILTRPDASWRTPIVFTRPKMAPSSSSSSVSLQLEYRLGGDAVHVRELRDDVVHVGTGDSLYWGNAWSAGDWALVGTAGTMLAWEDVYAYSTENYVSQGGGILLASYMCEMNQTWEVNRLSVGLVRARCLLGRLLECSSYGHTAREKR